MRAYLQQPQLEEHDAVRVRHRVQDPRREEPPDPLGRGGELAAAAAAAAAAAGTAGASSSSSSSFFYPHSRFDLVASGTNKGDNLGFHAWYSGTVGAAREGALSALPSLAFSLDDHGELMMIPREKTGEGTDGKVGRGGVGAVAVPAYFCSSFSRRKKKTFSLFFPVYSTLFSFSKPK